MGSWLLCDLFGEFVLEFSPQKKILLSPEFNPRKLHGFCFEVFVSVEKFKFFKNSGFFPDPAQKRFKKVNAIFPFSWNNSPSAHW